MLEKIRAELKLLRESHDLQSDQIKKIQEALDIADNKFIEAAVATDATRYEQDQQSAIIKKMEEMV